MQEPGEKVGAGAALFDERTETDELLVRERGLIDVAVSEIAQDTRFPRSTRAFVHQLAERIARARATADAARIQTRRKTDRALLSEGGDRVDAHQGLWEILTELEAIAEATALVRETPPGRAGEVDIFEVAGTVEVATNRILEIVENILDPEDDRGLYHETGPAG